MSDIQTYLEYIQSKVYGKDVRQAIVDAINQCYTDATTGITPVITTEQIAGGTRFIVTVGSVSTSFDVMNGISPQVATASTASAMTDTDLIYIYTGSETGYVNGDWYYYDGEEWQDGGQYQSTVPAVDSTLTITGAAADAKKTGDEIADLKSALNGGTIYNYTDGKNIDNSGALVDATGVCVSDKIPYTWTGSTRYYYGEASSDYAIAFYAADDSLLNKYISSDAAAYRSLNAETQVTGTVSYIRFSFKKNYSAKATKNDSTELPVYWSVQATLGGGLIDDVAALQEDIAALQETAAEGQLDAIELAINGTTTINYIEGKNLDADGNLVDDSTACVSEKIPYTWSGSTRYYYNELSTAYRIAFYASDDSQLVSRQSTDNSLYRSLNVSELTESTVAYIRFSFKKGTTGKAVQNANPEPSPYWVAVETVVNGLVQNVDHIQNVMATDYGVCIRTSADSLATGTTLKACEDIDNRKNDSIEFRAEITSFTSVAVGHGYQINHGMWVVVDGTYITTYAEENGTQIARQEHGLTISHFINVMINRGQGSMATIEVTTGSGLYRWENVAFYGTRGAVFALCNGLLTDVKLTAVFRDFNESIFMFGDSYQSMSSDRYPYYLLQNGFNKYLMSGFPGANSTHEIASFRAILALVKPKYVVWCLGMNDSDSDSAINATYKSYLDEVIATCEAYDIVPILATIPNVPERRHTYKNTYVKSLNLRYIDFAKAVGAESAGSTWYTGMLSSDNLHPSRTGAIALYAQLLADFPEIMQSN